jgi:hypothetical protein
MNAWDFPDLFRIHREELLVGDVAKLGGDFGFSAPDSPILPAAP